MNVGKHIDGACNQLRSFKVNVNERTIMPEIRKRQLHFFGHIMRKEFGEFDTYRKTERTEGKSE